MRKPRAKDIQTKCTLDHPIMCGYRFNIFSGNIEFLRGKKSTTQLVAEIT